MEQVLSWRVSSFSGGENNACVEIANTLGAVRDSKNPHGGTLNVDLRPLIGVVSSDAYVR